ncbi:MAG: von Willebrand factor type A domain-containing protein [Ilumatobacter sp.]
MNKTLAAVVAVGTILAACGGSDFDEATDDSAEEAIEEFGRDGGADDAEADISDPASTQAPMMEAEEAMDEGDEAMEEEAMEEEAMEEEDAMEEPTAEINAGGEAAPAQDVEGEFDDSADDAAEETADDSDGGLFGEQEPEPVDVEAPDDPDQRFDDNRFEDYGYRDFVSASADPLSTFALDVDTGSYSIGRRFLDEGSLPPRESVRPEEYVNAFDYDYNAPRNGLDITVDGGPSPFNPDNVLVRVGVQGEIVTDDERGDATLTFVIDTSGSMDQDNRLGLVKESLTILVEELNDDDRVAIVTYSDDSGVVLEPTRVRDRDRILDAIDSLQPGGSTNLESGLREGYDLARSAFNDGGINRVIIASDGVANAGITDVDRLAGMIREDADFGIDLVTVGFGMGNFNDVTMEQLADNGDGFYAYVDTREEAERLFEDELTSTLLTVAKDAKIQVDFDAQFVEAYRLIGFENRGVRDSDFDNDDVDAGELGAGHQVTAMYELELADGVSLDDRAELGVVALRWEDPQSGDVTEIDEDIDLRDIEPRWTDTADDFQLATVVITFAEKMRDNPYADDVDMDNLAVEAERIADTIDTDETDQLAELIERAADFS